MVGLRDAVVVQASGSPSAMAARRPVPRAPATDRPVAIVDLQTDAGVGLVGGEWRYRDATVREVDFVAVGAADDPFAPGDRPNHTFDIDPHAEARDYDDRDWRVLAPAETMLRLGNGRVCFNWYRIAVTIPQRLGELDPTGMTVVFEVVVDDYAEVWVDGNLGLGLGQVGGAVVAGFNAPNRVVLTHDARPGDRFQVAVFGLNGPISASPRNYIWLRSATLDFHRRAAPGGGELEPLATGFETTAGPVVAPDGSLLLSAPSANAIYRVAPDGRVELVRPKSGYAGIDIWRIPLPGSNGLAYDPDGRLTICEHGNRCVRRVNPRGDTVVLVDRVGGRRLNSPYDAVYRGDGLLYVSDPTFGLPGGAADPARELDSTPILRLGSDRDAATIASDAIDEPTGLALSSDECVLYAGTSGGDLVAFDVADDGSLGNAVTVAHLGAAVRGVAAAGDGRIAVACDHMLVLLGRDGVACSTVPLPEPATGVAASGEKLYVTTSHGAYRVTQRELAGP